MADLPIVVSVDAVAGKAQEVLMGVLRTINAIVSATLEAARTGDVMSDAWSGVQVNIDAARTSTQGEVKDLDLLQAAARATALDLNVTGEQFGALTGFAKRFADISGGDVRSAIDSMLNAMASGRTTSLKRMGFELQEGATKGEILESVLAQIPGRLAEMGPAIDTAGDAVARIDTAMANFSDRLALGMTETTLFASSMGDLAGMFERVAETGEAVGIVLGVVAGVIVDQFNEALDIVLSVGNAILRVYGQVASLVGVNVNVDVAGRIGSVSDAVNSIREAGATRREQEAFMGNLFESGPESTSFIRPITAAERRGAAGRTRGGGGGGRGRSAGERAGLRSIDEALGGLTLDNSAADQADHDAWLQTRRETIEKDNALMEAEGDRHNRVLAEQQAKRRLGEREALQGHIDDTKEWVRAESEMQNKSLDAIGSYTGAVSGILNQGAQLFGANKGTLAWMSAVEATVEAAVEWGRSLVPITGAAHIPAAIGLTGAAVFSFAKAAELGGERRGSPSLFMGGGRGSGGGGSGGSLGGSQAFAGYSPGGGWQAQQSIKVDVHINGMSLATEGAIADAVMSKVRYAMDSGRTLPARGISDR